MSSTERFNNAFSLSNLEVVYDRRVILSSAIGIDNLSHRTFWKTRQEQLAIIERKARAGAYTFTKFKLKLISKGRGKVPREISIPTIRDRIVLRVLCDLLAELFRNAVEFKIPQEIIKQAKVN